MNSAARSLKRSVGSKGNELAGRSANRGCYCAYSRNKMSPKIARREVLADRCGLEATLA